MAISGAWKAAQTQSGALKWGTGINPIHGIRTDARGRRLPAHTAQGGPGAPPLDIQEILLTSDIEPVDYADSAAFGYNEADGTALRPNYQQVTEEFRGKSKFMPSRDNGGMRFRPGNIGNATKRSQSKVSEREETVSEGWVNKDTDRVDNAAVSDVRQYEIQTSMSQRDLTRHGSQISGTASEHNAPVPSQRPTWGQRIKPWSGGRRHYDMVPQDQSESIRAFLYRNAGVGNVSWMGHNEATNYMTTPLDRQPVPPPYSGEQTPRAPSGPEYAVDTHDWIDSWY